jgi:hypothetical protein
VLEQHIRPTVPRRPHRSKRREKLDALFLHDRGIRRRAANTRCGLMCADQDGWATSLVLA